MSGAFLWIKAFHLIFVVAWFAGLFYLPRLFVNHAMSDNPAVHAQLKIMERKLLRFITPFMLLALGLGLWMLVQNWAFYKTAGWMHIKLAAVIALVLYHIWCAKLVADFQHERNHHSHVWYRWFNEIPVFFLFGIVILVIVRPTF